MKPVKAPHSSNVYHYASAPAFLRERWEEKRKRNPGFSLRAWSRQMGCESHAPLHLMIAGKRLIPKKYIPFFVSTLKLTPKEGLYFETLVDLSRAKGVEQKTLYLDRLKGLAPQTKVRMHEVDSFRCLGDPLHTILLEMSVLAGFKSDPHWIQSRLSVKTSIPRIQEAIERLLSLGLLKRREDGELIKTNQHLTNRPDVADLGSQEYHRKVSGLAADAVTTQKIEEREFNGYAFNIKKRDLPRAKQMMREFAQKFIQAIEAPSQEGEESYQLNLQFFKLTTNNEEKKI
ncbi:TIGR02147 family protein [Bdellovibrionota bacterium FG-2]